MGLVTWLEQIMVGFGAGWVMWLMLGLNVISVAIILERAWFFHTLRDDVSVLAHDLRTALDVSLEAAGKRLEQSPSAEAAVVLAGIAMSGHGVAATEEAMAGASALQRMKLERSLVYLATLGNNAPFIGLFGTVIGIIGAFKALGEQAVVPAAEVAQQVLAPQAVMGSISEALVATAIGIGIAIPAVAANNYFMRATRTKLANTEALTKVLLAHMKSTQGLTAAANHDDSGSSADDGVKDDAAKDDADANGGAKDDPAKDGAES
jgi:biopolymer transport protein ExbB